MDKKSVWLDINKLSEDDFTMPGERIPSDAGLADFIRYNVAHFDPTAEEILLGMGGTTSAIKKMIKPPIQLRRLSEVMGDKKIKKTLDNIPETFLPEGKWKEDAYNYRLNTIEDPYVAIKDKKTIGHLGVDDQGRVKSVYVSPEFRGRGIAKEMYRQGKELEGVLGSDELHAMEPAAKSIWEALMKERPEQILKTKKGYFWSK